MKPGSSYELELKALLTKEQYANLCNELPQKMKLINKETIHTSKFRKPDHSVDIRLRHSDKTFEIVCKQGFVTEKSRKEITIPLKTKEHLEHFLSIFSLLDLKQDPSWKTHRQEFEYKHKGHTYTLCLQDIENFAYILEVEHLSTTENIQVHESNLREIIKSLGCEPINNEEFSQKIQEYIKDNKTD